MTQITLVAPVQTAATPQVQAGQSATAAVPEEFALALDQAIGAMLAGTDITQVFQIANGGDKANAVASSWRAVALENLAAGSIPEGVLDAIRIKISPVGANKGAGQGEAADEQDKQVEVATLLSYLASLLTPAVVPQQVSPVAVSTGETADQTQAQAIAAAVESIGTTSGTEAPAQLPGVPEATPAAPDTTAAGQDVQAQVAAAAPSDEAVPTVTTVAPVVPEASDEVAGRTVAQAKIDVGREETMPPVEKPQVARQNGDSSAASAGRDGETLADRLVPATVEVSKDASAKIEASEPAAVKPRQAKAAVQAESTAAVDSGPKAAGQQTAAAQSAGLQGQVPVETQVVQQVTAEPARGQAKGDTESVDAVQQSQSEGGMKPSEARAAKAEAAGGANQERFIARIASAITEAERSGRSVVRLRLYPPELGTVRIEVSSVRGTVSARIEASTQTTQGMLQSNLSSLRADLREAGVDLRDMRVEFRDPSLAFGSQDRSTHRGGHDDQRQTRSPRAEREAERIEPVGALAQEAGVSGLNLYI